MTQNSVNYANNPTGPELLDDYLAKEQQNNLTSNSGIQRPSYAVAGTKWLDTSATPWVLKYYDGTSDVVIGTIDTTSHIFTPSGLNSAVLLTSDQTVAGVKTFSSSPLVPNVTAGDSSSKAANTAFVAAGLANKVGLTGDQTIAGVKTFSSSPLAPNVTAGDSSSKVANTAFVATGLSGKADVSALNDKIQEVSVAPVSPITGVLYVIPES